jgi:Arc/MetJ-type ribon-helix-helix transcriptional regulator
LDRFVLAKVKSGRYENASEVVPAAVGLSIDGKKVAAGRIDEQIPMRCGTETMDVGMDCVSPVCSDYEKKGLFPFNGKIESVTFQFAKAKHPTGMQRLELATKMD